MTGSSGKFGIFDLFHLFLFLVIPLLWISFFFIFGVNISIWYLVIAQAGISAYFFFARPGLFIPGLYFVILLLTSFLPLPEKLWLFNIFLALIVLLLLCRLVPFLKKKALRLPLGAFDKNTVIYSIIIIALSAAALILWKELTGPDISVFLDTAENIDRKFILLALLTFPLLNAIAEELMFRWILWAGLEELKFGAPAIIVIQAAVFGLSHFPGFPSGWLGVLMASFYGLMLGYIRHRSGGLAVPILTHTFADITIILIIFSSAGII